MSGPIIPMFWSVIFFSVGGPLIDHESSTILNLLGWALLALGAFSGKYIAISTLAFPGLAIYSIGTIALFLFITLANVVPRANSPYVNAFFVGVAIAAVCAMAWRLYIATKIKSL